MSEESPPVDEMNYDLLAQEALRGVIRAALERAASPEGIPGEHHFYISFLTRAPGVSLPDDIRAKYPTDMTVVLQHQYWDLVVEARQFSVKLKFGGIPRVLTVPYEAIIRFYDPSVNFLLQFDPMVVVEDEEPAEPIVLETAKVAGDTAAKDKAVAEPTDDGDDDGPKVVSLDQFRKK
ncbi:MAG: stringent starvation protein B [Brevundimonas sp.]|nr:MAG: stringent starvation protein B [Brevundimonas sp.]